MDKVYLNRLSQQKSKASLSRKKGIKNGRENQENNRSADVGGKGWTVFRGRLLAYKGTSRKGNSCNQDV